MKISYRLIRVAQTVTPGYRVADIGTDHGYVPIYLIKNGLAEHVIAMDVNELAPNLDISGASTATACKIVRELLMAVK